MCVCQHAFLLSKTVIIQAVLLTPFSCLMYGVCFAVISALSILSKHWEKWISSCTNNFECNNSSVVVIMNPVSSECKGL